MDQKKVINILLVILPLVAVVMAGMANAVTVYAVTETETTVVYCSFFTLIEDVQFSVCLPAAGLCGAVAFGMAVIYLVKKTGFWLTGITLTSFASMTLAVLPIVYRADTYLIPNMLVPILMLMEAMIAYGVLKTPVPQEEKKTKAKLLQR